MRYLVVRRGLAHAGGEDAIPAFPAPDLSHQNLIRKGPNWGLSGVLGATVERLRSLQDHFAIGHSTAANCERNVPSG